MFKNKILGGDIIVENNLRAPLATLIVTFLLVILIFLLLAYGNLATSIVAAVITIIIGVLTLVFGQIVIKFVIEPIQRQQELIGKIAHNLIYYADIWSNPGFASKENHEEPSKIFRQQSSELRALTNLIKGYHYFSGLGLVPSFENVDKAAKNLIGLSNSLIGIFHYKHLSEPEFRLMVSKMSDENQTKINQIENSLNIKMGLGIKEE